MAIRLDDIQQDVTLLQATMADKTTKPIASALDELQHALTHPTLLDRLTIPYWRLRGWLDSGVFDLTTTTSDCAMACPTGCLEPG